MEPTLKATLDLVTLTGIWIISVFIYLVLTMLLPLIITLGRHNNWSSVMVLVQYHTMPYYLYAKYRFEKPGGPGLRHWTSIVNRKHSFYVLQTKTSSGMLAVTQFKDGVLYSDCHYITLPEWEEERKKFGLYPVTYDNAEK